ncbi:MAG: hypothetical protein WC141_05700 [Arcobacteraceae bacterium]
MNLLFLILQLFFATLIIILVYQTLKYTHTMWRFKKSSKQNKKESDFKRFD